MATIDSMHRRLDAIEQRRTPTQRSVYQVIVADGDHEAGEALARSYGWSVDDENSILIIQSIVSPAGQVPYREPPRMFSRTAV